MPKRTASYEDWLAESLKNPDKAAAYLDEHLASDEEDTEELLLALRDVAAAQGRCG